MDWKKENIKTRYIDEMKWDEAKQIAFIATGEPEGFELIKLDASCNGNNIPHVKLHYKAYEPSICEEVEDFVGIFENSNVYLGVNFMMPYCQTKLADKIKELQFD